LASKVKSPASLKRILAKTKKKAVFTNGCFDILHKGHVTYLEQARKQGDLLIVALNSDSSIKSIKGPNRPINCLEDRLEVLAALESVDYVTWFETDTPLDLITLLRPKILVKGGDWKANQIVGSTEVLSWGGKVRSLAYVEGRSTTQIIAKARGEV
jgi:rfaE bifunctional protein nucleotidyltransferase chain/domain